MYTQSVHTQICMSLVPDLHNNYVNVRDTVWQLLSRLGEVHKVHQLIHDSAVALGGEGVVLQRGQQLQIPPQQLTLSAWTGAASTIPETAFTQCAST